MIEPGVRRLACAVILKWMEDYLQLFKKSRKTWTKEDKVTYNWLNTKDAKEWCEYAGISMHKLREWKEKVDQKKEIIRRLPFKGIKTLKQIGVF